MQVLACSTHQLQSARDTNHESSYHIEDQHHAIISCSGYAYAREHFQELFHSRITTVRQFLIQPQRSQLAKFLTETRIAHKQSLVCWVCARPQSGIQIGSIQNRSHPKSSMFKIERCTMRFASATKDLAKPMLKHCRIS